MLKTTAILLEELKRYANPAAKIKRLVKAGSLIPVVRGLYETNRNTPGYCLAASVYGPSYLSFEFALSYHALIPEAVHTFTCATFEKKKAKHYVTPFGQFTYRDVPGKAYPLGVSLRAENGYSVLIAQPEKALCDLLYTISPRDSQAAFQRLLYEDLRIDDAAFGKLDPRNLLALAACYHTANHGYLQAFIGRQMKNGLFD